MKKWISGVLQSRWFYVSLLLLTGALHSNAQKEDLDYSDSTVTDTVVEPSQIESTSEDTSQNFFNWKENVNQPYSNSKIGSRVHTDKEVGELKKDDAFWYVKSIEKSKSAPEKVIYEKAGKDGLAKKGKAHIETQQFPQEDEHKFNLPSWVGTLIWAVIIGVFLFAVVYFLSANKINIFSRSKSNKMNGIEADSEEMDLFKIPYQELLQKAYAEKNYRLAVRILYLQTLKLLSEKNIIAFQAEYTNMDYLHQLSQTMFYKDFFAITRHYEYIWYGGFPVSEPAFHTIQNDFNTIQSKILHR